MWTLATTEELTSAGCASQEGDKVGAHFDSGALLAHSDERDLWLVMNPAAVTVFAGFGCSVGVCHIRRVELGTCTCRRRGE